MVVVVIIAALYTTNSNSLSLSLSFLLRLQNSCSSFFVVVVLCLHLKKILQKNNGGRGGWGTQTICNNIYVLCFAYTHTRAYTFSHAHELTKTNGSRDANVDAHDINDATTTTTQRPWTCPNASMNRTELNACPTPTTTTTVGCCCVALPECCLCCCCC